MIRNFTSHLSLLASAAVLSTGLAQANGELISNGGFETGDTTSWESFPTPNSTFLITSDANTGSFAAELMNPDEAAAAIIKQTNMGAGSVQPGDSITVSFFAKGNLGVGGVVFAEFFSEIAGGGLSSSEILGGGPIFPGATYQQYTFTTTAGPDVSGGVTLQIGAITGAVIGSFANVTIDDVSVRITSPSAVNYCGTTPNSAGMGAIMGHSGSLSVSAQDLVIEASGLPSSTFAIFAGGPTAGMMPSFDGTLCIGGTCRISPVVSATAGGFVSTPITDASYIAGGCAPPLAGETFNFQCLYRDSIGVGGNWSDALCVTFGA